MFLAESRDRSSRGGMAYGSVIDFFGQVANIHMRTDAKNLAAAARTIHLPFRPKIAWQIA